MLDKVYINGRFLQQKFSGTQRFAEFITRNIDQILAESRSVQKKYILLCPKGPIRDIHLEHIEIVQAGAGNGHLWEQISLPRLARDGALVNFINSGPLLHGKQIVTFHDASIYEMPHLFSWKYRLFHKMVRGGLARRAQRIITVSSYSRRRFSEIYHADAKMIVVPNGSDHIDQFVPDVGILSRNGVIPGSYILCVGNASPNKNLSAAFRAWSALSIEGLQLVTVGAVDTRVFGGDGSIKSADKNGRGVISLTGVSDNELAALYKNAAVFLFPSFYEGFGIPPLEAMRFGCPVVATKAAAVPDTVGDAALIIDPNDIQSICDALRKVLQDETLRKDLVNRGTARAEQFRWSKSATIVYDAIQGLK